MRLLITVFLIVLASPAFAISDSLIQYCMTTQNPTGCIQTFLADERQAQREHAAMQYQAQLDAARAQADGLALFGTGPALIQGMNQGFQMQQQPIRPLTPLPPAIPVR